MIIVGGLTSTPRLRVVFGPFGTFAGPSILVIGLILAFIALVMMGYLVNENDVVPESIRTFTDVYVRLFVRFMVS
jgi:hypothetical protein